MVATSTNGGSTWTQRQVSAATNNTRTDGRQDCALRTDSHGVVYLMYDGFSVRLHSAVLIEQRSADGGATFTRPQIAAVVGQTVSPTRCRAGSRSTGWLSANALTSEFLGDCHDIKASAAGAVAVWNDVRNAADCPAIDAFRQSLVTGPPIAVPARPLDARPRSVTATFSVGTSKSTQPSKTIPGRRARSPAPGDVCSPHRNGCECGDSWRQADPASTMS